jgi:uncharacterized protein
VTATDPPSPTHATPWSPPTAKERKAILDSVRSIAIVGASSNPARPSYFVATYLLSSSCDYRVWFVNPKEAAAGNEILGHPVYPSLASVAAEHGPPDVVVAFRRPDDLPEVASEAVAVGAKVLWMQLGLTSDQAVARAHAAGLSVVQDRCIKIEHARFAGGLHLAGFDTGVVDSRRPRR